MPDQKYNPFTGGVHVQESGAEQMLEALTAHGVVWRQPGERTYRPGVPSLLDFVAAEAAPLADF